MRLEETAKLILQSKSMGLHTIVVGESIFVDNVSTHEQGVIAAKIMSVKKDVVKLYALIHEYNDLKASHLDPERLYWVGRQLGFRMEMQRLHLGNMDDPKFGTWSSVRHKEPEVEMVVVKQEEPKPKIKAPPKSVSVTGASAYSEGTVVKTGRKKQMVQEGPGLYDLERELA